MRICIVSQEYAPLTQYFGGIGSQYGRLAPALAELGHEVHVVALAGGDEPAQVGGVHLHYVQRPRVWPWYPWAYARKAEAALRGLGRFDVVLAPEFRGELSTYARRQDQGPLLTHLLTSSAQLIESRPGLSFSERRGVRARLNMRGERVQAARSRALSGPSDGVVELSRARWPEIAAIPTLMLPLSTDIDAVRRAAAVGEPPAAFPRDVATVTLPSRLDGHKGGQFLIEALRPLWHAGADVRLVFVGREGTWDGRPIREHLSAVAGADRDRVVFLGEQDEPSYFGAVAASTVVAIPSLWESFCIAGLEALALARPLVATRGHGFDAFVRDGENGLLVDREDVLGLRAALERLLADAALRERLGAEGVRTADAHDVARIAPLYVEAFASVASLGS